MAETKTKPTGASVDAYLASRASPEQLALQGHHGHVQARYEATAKDVGTKHRRLWLVRNGQGPLQDRENRRPLA